MVQGLDYLAGKLPVTMIVRILKNGVPGSSHLKMPGSNCTPCGTALGATFDTENFAEIGGLLARDAKAKGSSLLLDSTCNIQRHPGNGRVSQQGTQRFKPGAPI
jgi:hypothetical protein